MLVNNYQKNYACSEYATFDEVLVAFRSRFGSMGVGRSFIFRMYIKTKPVNYGLKIMCLCDSKDHYFPNGFVYTGRSNRRELRKLNIPTFDVLNLVKPIENTNTNT